ncbi:MAG: hypothetical protein ACI8ZM_005664 [Crocinitomix sp.]|jgi:hypothetical protein
MKKVFITLLFTILPLLNGFSLDTLYTNPNYPPIVYSKTEYKFYKYTVKYIPSNLFHAFKILGSNDSHIIERFKRRTIPAVVNKGIYYPSARLRKEFCLEGYSDFVLGFHKMGVYYPKAMETFVLLSFHQYLNQEKIEWTHNKSVALDGHKKSNRVWRKRKRKLFKNGEVRVKDSRRKNKKKKSETEAEDPDQKYWGEFEKK